MHFQFPLSIRAAEQATTQNIMSQLTQSLNLTIFLFLNKL